MRFDQKLVGILGVALGLAACGGSLTPSSDGGGGSGGTSGGGTTGSGGATVECATMSGCECLAASDRCTPRAEACWCPTECTPGAPIECVCGGGKFLACVDKDIVAVCAGWLAAVQSKCAGQGFVADLSPLCDAAANPLCVSACLANLQNTGSCSEIDCSFCQVCDCAPPPAPSPFTSCLRTCVTN